MKSIINAYLSIDGLRNIEVKSFGDKPNNLDRVLLDDRIGNILQLDAAIICKALEALASSRKLTVGQYLTNFKNGAEGG